MCIEKFCGSKAIWSLHSHTNTHSVERHARVRFGLPWSQKECDFDTEDSKQTVRPPTTRCPLRCCLIKQWQGLQEAHIDLPISAWFQWNLPLGWKARAQMWSRHRSDWSVMSLPASWIFANGFVQTPSCLGTVNAFSSEQGDWNLTLLGVRSLLTVNYGISHSEISLSRHLNDLSVQHYMALYLTVLSPRHAWIMTTWVGFFVCL